jgi:hypothetical protein
LNRFNFQKEETMSILTAVEIVQEFWRLMATNDFSAVAAVLDSEFVLE